MALKPFNLREDEALQYNISLCNDGHQLLGM